ncbi:hypothetical protein [[Eubacterium] cellulosolvens]
MVKDMSMPCTVCGTINRVSVDAEFIFCTACGAKIDIGVHSYRTDGEFGLKVYCVNCSQKLDASTVGSIYSCNSCGEHVCDICSKATKGKHYCPNCYSALPEVVEKFKKAAPKKRAPRKPSKPKKKGKTKAKSKAKPKGKEKKKPKEKTKAKAKGKVTANTGAKPGAKFKGKDKGKAKSNKGRARKARAKSK